MLRQLLLAGLAGAVLTAAAFGQTTKGQITANETWSGNVTITGDLVVTGGTLTIQPGTVVKFATTQATGDIIYGTASQITLVAALAGAIQAVGTANQPIKFTTTNIIMPAAGAWGMIKFIGNGTRSRFSYCTIEYCGDGFNIENPTGVTEVSSPVIDHCTVRKAGGSGIFAGSGSNVGLDHCVFEDCNIAIFYDGTGTTPITNTYIYNTSCAIILAGRATPVLNATIDHCSIYNVDMGLSGTPQWWTGYGIYGTNTAGTLSITNTIINKTSLFGCVPGAHALTYDYNAYFDGLGVMETGTPGTHCVATDPLYQAPATNDFRLDAGSPCKNVSSTGNNIGAWQDADTWPVFGTAVRDRAAANAPALRLATYPNPTVSGVRISLDGVQGQLQASIFDMRGRLVNTLTGSRELVWDRTDAAGRTVTSGLYFVRALVNGQTISRSVIVN